jgi:hypothetical protein
MGATEIEERMELDRSQTENAWKGARASYRDSSRGQVEISQSPRPY